MQDITDLKNKVANGGDTAEGRLAPDEWKRLVTAVIENQGGVKSISLNNSNPVTPDEEGNVNIMLAQGDYEQVMNVKYNGQLLTGETSILSADGDVTLQFQFKESKIIQQGNDVSYEPTGQIVTVSISRFSDNTTTELKTMQYQSVGHSSEVFIDIPLSQYLVDGEQSIQIRVTNTSDAAVVQKSIPVTKASLELRVERGASWFSNAKTTNDNTLTTRYYVLGVVTGKVLNIKFTGTEGSRTMTTIVDTNDPMNTVDTNFVETIANNIGFFGSNGIRTVEAWITYTLGDTTVESNHIVNQIIVVSDLSTAQPMIAIQENVGLMDNYETETIFSWNMFNPVLADNETSDVTLMLADENKSTIYLSFTQEGASNNVSYDFTQNVSIESSNNYIDVFIFGEIDGTAVGETYLASFSVDNTVDYSVVGGADFYMNPALRTNNESNPARIINVSDGTEISGCVFNGMSWKDGYDGWTLNEDNRRVLRIPAGASIEIPYDVYSEFTNNARHHLTIELDFAIRNVTNEDDPVLTIGNANVDNPKGVFLKPLNGAFMTASNSTWHDADVSWQEGVRTHLVFNIQHNYAVPNPDTTRNSATMAYVDLIRTYINGIINREFTFDSSAYSEINAGGNIIIGQSGCDVDIFGIRIYKDTNDKSNLTPTHVLRNYINTLPTGDERAVVKGANDIMDGGLISLAKARNKGYNCIVWHGQPVNKSNNIKQKRYGYAEIYQYDENKNLDRARSGILYGIEMKGQGTTAMGYAEWNVQYKEDKDNVGGDSIKYDDNGTLRNVFVDVDGVVSYGAADNKKKFGFMLDEGDPKAKKLVGKINYASSMQSHKMGATNLYNDLYRHCVSDSVTDFDSGERVTVKEKPFLYFVQRSEGDADNLKVFQGLMTFGPGKADKPTWGVSDEDMMAGDSLIEGALNNTPLGDARVPFIDNGKTITYSVSEESFMYAGETNLDFGFGDTADLHEGVGAWENVVQDASKETTEVPTTAFVKRWQPIWNFLYLTNVGIKPWDGTLDELNVAANEDGFDYKSAYWMNSNGSGYSRFDLYRCHYEKNGTIVSKTFVPAGIRLLQGSQVFHNFDCLYQLNEGEHRPTSYSDTDMWYDVNANGQRTLEFNLKTSLETFLGITINTTVASSVINTTFKKHLGDIFALYADQDIYVNKKSMLFHHEIMKLWAGTDNRSKNTYYRYNPYANNIEMNDDDLDNILKTNNAGIQSKPYYILEQDVDSEGRTYWDGQNNALNNTLEATYGLTLGVAGDRQSELQNMMRTILSVMATQLVGDSDTMPDGTRIESTPLGCFDKYFFSIQKYFPIVAYNETARIRYEVPALFYMSENPAQAPLTQSLGDQYESEREYAKRRIIMLSGYAGYEMDMLSFRGYLGSYTTTLIPHYYIFPMSKMGNPSDQPVKTNVRVPAGQSYVLNQGSAVQGNTTFLHFINELTSIGNIGTWGNGTKDGDASSVITFTSQRLKQFLMYGETAADVTFPASQVDISGCTNVEVIDVHNASLLTSFVNGISTLLRLRYLDITGTGIQSIAIPENNKIEDLYLPDTLTALTLRNQMLLNSYHFGFTPTNLKSLNIGNVGLDTQEFIFGWLDILETKTMDNTYTLIAEGINWTGVAATDLVRLMAIPNLVLKGRITLDSNSITAEQLDIVADKLDTYIESGELVLVYTNVISLTLSSLSIVGGDPDSKSDFVISSLALNDLYMQYSTDGETWYPMSDNPNLTMVITRTEDNRGRRYVYGTLTAETEVTTAKQYRIRATDNIKNSVVYYLGITTMSRFTGVTISGTKYLTTPSTSYPFSAELVPSTASEVPTYSWMIESVGDNDKYRLEVSVDSSTIIRKSDNAIMVVLPNTNNRTVELVVGAELMTAKNNNTSFTVRCTVRGSYQSEVEGTYEVIGHEIFTPRAVQSYDPEEVNYNPALIIYLKNNEATTGVTLHEETFANGSRGFYMTQAEAATVTSLGTINGLTQIQDTEGYVVESYEDGVLNPDSYYRFENFNQFKYFTSVTDLRYIGNCTYLKYLTIHKNARMIESFPSTIVDLTFDSGFTGFDASTYDWPFGWKIISVTNLFLPKTFNDSKGNNPRALLKFIRCSNLYFEGTITEWMNLMIGGNDLYNQKIESFSGYDLYCNNVKITEINSTDIENGIPTNIMRCKSLVSVNGMLNNLYANQFICCTSLQNISLSSSINTIPDQCFYNCSNLKFSTIPNNITSIGANAFSGSGASFSEIPDSVTSFGGQSNMPNITAISYPNTMNTPGGFTNCANLRSVYFRKNEGDEEYYITTLPNFSGCNNITKIGYEEYFFDNSFIVLESVTSLRNDRDTYGFPMKANTFAVARGLTYFAFSWTQREPKYMILDSCGYFSDSRADMGINGGNNYGSLYLKNISTLDIYLRQACFFVYIWINNTVPPVAKNFNGKSPAEKIFVPIGCKGAYLEASIWNGLTSYIIEYDFDRDVIGIKTALKESEVDIGNSPLSNCGLSVGGGTATITCTDGTFSSAIPIKLRYRINGGAWSDKVNSGATFTVSSGDSIEVYATHSLRAPSNMLKASWDGTTITYDYTDIYIDPENDIDENGVYID